MNNKNLFELAHTRVASQKKKMEECIRLGLCPFCWENLAEWHDSPVEARGKHWIITANDHPYSGAKHHYLAIYRIHIASIWHMDPKAGSELFAMFYDFCQKRGIPGASILFRFGDMKYTGATVAHLHAHIVSGTSRGEVLDPKYPDSFITSVLGYKMPE